MISVLLLVILSAASCSGAKKVNSDVVVTGEQKTSSEQAVVTGEQKTLLEQAVEWGNDNLFTEKKAYGDFSLQSKQSGDKKYNFLLEKEDNNWECELYYIECDADNNFVKVTACGGGNKDLFTLDIVNLSGENYAAVANATHMGNGNLELYPLDKESSRHYSIDGVIDNHYESMALVDDNGYDYSKSQVYYDGRLNVEYTDVNKDGYTDIVLSGIILEYEAYPGEESVNTYGKLTDSQNCKRTYLYNSSRKQFEQSTEVLDSVYQKDGAFYEYTGYLDLHPKYAEGNPRFDYDGDGLLDRVYKQYGSDKNTSSFYLYFGNGNKLLLSDYSRGIFYKTEAVELTGDGVKEILFEQFSTSTKCENLYLSIYTLKNGSYERMDIPYYGKEKVDNEEDQMLYLPLVMKKDSDSRVSIYQPDLGYQGYITTQKDTYVTGDNTDEMGHLYYPDIEGVVQNYQASTMSYTNTEEAGKKAFLFRCYLGDKWCNKSVFWKLEYIAGEWNITNVYQTDPIRVEVGAKFKADLNGDKTDDTVYYQIQTVKENGYDIEVPYLKINATEYNYKYLEKLGVAVTDCSQIGYYILDIDTSDSYREIAILDEGPSNDPRTYIFRYTGEELKYCGYVTDFPDHSTFCTNGDGSITASKRLSILQTWWADATWKLSDEDILVEQSRDMYYTYQPVPEEATTNHATRELKLYKRPDKTSASITVKKGEIIQLTATDNKNWIEIISESGTIGWFYLHDGFEVTLPTGEFKIGDIVTHLNMAD